MGAAWFYSRVLVLRNIPRTFPFFFTYETLVIVARIYDTRILTLRYIVLAERHMTLDC